MKPIFNTLLLLCLTFSLSAQDVTYAKDIASILYTHCSSCHRQGEIGPFSLSNYEDAKAWGTTIKHVTQNKIMPPWQPDPNYTHFLEENFLTDDEIGKIADWVDNSMPRGDVSIEPSFPDFPEGSVLGTPDLVLEMAEPYMHEGNNLDDYRYFVLPTNFAEDKIIKAMEFRAGNAKIVHHALVFEDDSGVAAMRDATTPEYGFPGFGSFQGGSSTDILNQKQFPGYVPGQKPIFFPDGVGQVLKAGADVVIQVHYAPWPVDESDQSKLNIFFADETETIDRELEGHIMVPFFSVINDLFFIQPNTVREFHGTWEVPKDISLINIAPHMHLLGQHWEVYIEHTNGDITPLIRINEWDFNWQGGYYFPKYIKAEQDATIHAIASYDNTTNNPSNPSNPPVAVSWGDLTTDEMYFLPINFVDYETGDEDIYFGETTTPAIDVVLPDLKLNIFPNPAEDYCTIEFELDRGEAVDIELYDMAGQKIRQLRQGEFFNTGKHAVLMNMNHLPSGSYILRVSGKRHQLATTLVKQGR